ncbi:hypothetical protein GLOIN_2v848380 [Rhizophagus irregularis DAOM 181602=DAOM 197198]|uniref:Uncharacterized protein n=1 Tax=Rhizophagus irregularis (strain DAOM 181602 / DAOM 197198 / MUCL 43194) TaxID=747089 RepID=A0A2P4QGK7_RHIID|nr:hypothetical protein GLOIN_2v848380 [Rhizophagus irregularis DAOM 181602=DAOM 197198]POG76779.1 hypothetical protein GLOIN_2v848380 [Rhizophagus irregularis DAOM 181602=DAOM 197198]|eukprot:XP_025183645.1 hypothetical protein GLOIN_2v848380 [Rhizophagus irregularis DAOM 181602=DAOM 197198]
MIFVSLRILLLYNLKHACNFIEVNHLKNGAFFRRTFIILFYNESTFRYSPAQRKYTCKFEGGQGYEQLGILLENKNWGSKKCRAGTCAYVLMQNAQQTYHVTFCWKERVYKELDMSLRCGSMHFEFNIDVRDFVEGNVKILFYFMKYFIFI